MNFGFKSLILTILLVIAAAFTLKQARSNQGEEFNPIRSKNITHTKSSNRNPTQPNNGSTSSEVSLLTNSDIEPSGKTDNLQEWSYSPQFSEEAVALLSKDLKADLIRQWDSARESSKIEDAQEIMRRIHLARCQAIIEKNQSN